MNCRTVAILLSAWITTLLAGCFSPHEITKTPRSAIEQLLLSQALNRSLLEISVPLSTAEPLYIEVTGLQLGYMAPLLPMSTNSGALSSSAMSTSSAYFAPANDLVFIRDAVAGHLGVLGYRVLKEEQDATYVVRVVVQSFGTNQSSSFFGLPPIQSVIIPFSLPQLTVYQNLAQNGYVRYGVEVIERSTGRLYYSTPWYSQRTYHDQYTLLFFVTFRSTDLDQAP